MFGLEENCNLGELFLKLFLIYLVTHMKPPRGKANYIVHCPMLLPRVRQEYTWPVVSKAVLRSKGTMQTHQRLSNPSDFTGNPGNSCPCAVIACAKWSGSCNLLIVKYCLI